MAGDYALRTSVNRLCHLVLHIRIHIHTHTSMSVSRFGAAMAGAIEGTRGTAIEFYIRDFRRRLNVASSCRTRSLHAEYCVSLLYSTLLTLHPLYIM